MQTIAMLTNMIAESARTSPFMIITWRGHKDAAGTGIDAQKSGSGSHTSPRFPGVGDGEPGDNRSWKR